jgi:hypothetical protein
MSPIPTRARLTTQQVKQWIASYNSGVSSVTASKKEKGLARMIQNGQAVFKPADPRLGYYESEGLWMHQDIHFWAPTKWIASIYHVKNLPCPNQPARTVTVLPKNGFFTPPSLAFKGWDRPFHLIGYRLEKKA